MDFHPLAFYLFVCMGVSVISSYMIGYGADDLNLSGDEKSFDLFIATVVLSIIILLIYGLRNRNEANKSLNLKKLSFLKNGIFNYDQFFGVNSIVIIQ
jgi:predicted membrane channel-forming protein YqfA (hemolysin III family)